MARASAYRTPGAHQIYTSDGRLRDIGDLKPRYDLIARPDVVADWIAAGLMLAAFGAVALTVYGACIAFSYVGGLVGGGS